MISRQEALELLKSCGAGRVELIHAFESEAIMGALATRLGQNTEYWRMLGLLHDVDWNPASPEEHLRKAPQILRKAGFDEKFIQIVLSHGYGWEWQTGLERHEKVEHALACAETITGLIHAYAILRKGLEGMDADGVKKRMKDKHFAAGVDRQIIMECEQIGLSLDEFLQISIKALQQISKDIGF
jgi:putative nucleotidyltransferase with HDIG domain